MRKSERVYVNEKDISVGSVLNSSKVAVWNALRRNGVIKGNCFLVNSNGIFVGPNYTTINKYLVKGAPQVEFSDKAKNFVQTNSKVPTHITLIDKSGRYL